MSTTPLGVGLSQAKRQEDFKSRFWVLMVLALTAAFPAWGQHRQDPVKIGVLAKRGTEKCLEQWSPTAAYLTSEIPGFSFTIVPLDYDEIYPAVERGEVDFILANSSFYVGLERLHGAGRIVTLKNLCSGRACTVFAGVIFCKVDRKDIERLNDLKGKTFMAVNDNCFGGWRMAWREMKEHGIDPWRDFADLRFGDTYDAVVYAVRDGIVDAGNVRTDMLERMEQEGAIRLDEFRVIHDQSGEKAHLPFVHSTRAYPEWPLAKVQHTSDELAENVAAALMKMSSDSAAAKAANCAGWTVPLNYQPVHECLMELRATPYEDYGKVTFADILKRYWLWLIVIAVFLAAMAVTIVRVLRLNRDQHRLGAELESELSEHRRTENDLRETRDFLENLIKYANAPIIVWNPVSRITRFNHAFEHLTGYNADEVIGREVCLLFPEQSKEESLCKIARTAGGEYWETVEIPIRCKNGEMRSTLWNSANIYSEDGTTLLATIAQGLDITKQKRAEETKTILEAQLRQAQKMEAVGQLAGGVAHDFNNILTAILGNVELMQTELQAELPADDSLVTGLAQIDRAGKRAASLTRQLLAFSRQQVFKPQLLELNQLIRDIEGMLRNLLDARIEFEFSLEPGLAHVLADAVQIEQILMNLVLNARDAMPTGGKLTVETANVFLDESYVNSHAGANHGPHIMIAVSDTGDGMDKPTRERIFEPFFTTKPLGRGTGLGLSTIYGIVQQTKGSITVDSEVDRGTTFKIYLPAVDSPAVVPAEQPDESRLDGQETVMVCEDEESVRTLACRILERGGYTPLAAESGSQALEIAMSHAGPIHILVTDVVMPGMNGPRLAEKLCATRPDTKVLFISGYTGNAPVTMDMLPEDVEFLEKPFSLRSLLGKVRRVLDSVEH